MDTNNIIGEASLCKNNCGFYGNPRFENYCSKCFGLKKTRDEPSISQSPVKIEEPKEIVKETQIDPLTVLEPKTVIVKTPKKKNICAYSSCRRKLTLTCVQCHCGETFCTSHRYAEDHECPFDYKNTKKEYLTKNNPEVKPSKITKI